MGLTSTLSTHDSSEGLRKCQIATPNHLVARVWTLALGRRKRFGRVLDLGAGDGRFAVGGTYAEYVGVEVDRTRRAATNLPAQAIILHACASEAPTGFDLAIGNPPYTRHQDIDPRWREHVRGLILAATGHEVSRYANLYVYFMWLSLLKTANDGVVSLVVPYEWISRPSAASLRDYLSERGYSADVYRLTDDARLFPGVKTTASITVIDKASRPPSKIVSYDLPGRKGVGQPRRLSWQILGYEEAVGPRAFRGFSPGSQDVFTLTETERRAARISLRNVVPCVTSLRLLPRELRFLTTRAFQRNYVAAGRKCWLLKTLEPVSFAVATHLAAAPKAVVKNWTCASRDPWYAYELPPIPDIIYSSGFRGTTPRAIVNSCGARIVGAAHGIALPRGLAAGRVQEFLADSNFSTSIVPHARGLRKVEVRQMNAALNGFPTHRGGEGNAKDHGGE